MCRNFYDHDLEAVLKKRVHVRVKRPEDRLQHTFLQARLHSIGISERTYDCKRRPLSGMQYLLESRIFADPKT